VVFPDPGIVDAGGWLADIAADFVDHGSGMVIVDQSDQQPLVRTDRVTPSRRARMLVSNSRSL
jgi:hypothetical protein